MLYRFLLDIVWDESLPLLAGIGLNPSTATHEVNDRTISKMCGFARREGCGGLRMLNIFAWRATDPKGMKAAPEPIGDGNDVKKMLDLVRGPVVACWGNHGAHLGRGPHIRELIPGMVCFGRNNDGSPKHPLYLRATRRIYPFT
jgi:hypothetical protein